MGRMLLLDLFCGAGGSAMGYSKAGFDVIGVDDKPQPNYPFEFYQADALEFCKKNSKSIDVIHASPPCQAHTKLARIWISRYGKEYWNKKHPDMIAPTRTLLKDIGKPYVIENVPGAPLYNPVLLCGTMFGLKVYRHRLFESNILLLAPSHSPHHDNCHSVGQGKSKNGFISITGHGGFGFIGSFEYAQKAMGIDWMSRLELSQAIPPAYTEYLGRQLRKHLLTISVFKQKA